MTDPSGAAPAGDPGKPSGLRNPTAAVRGVGAGALGSQALVLLLAIVPLAKVGGTAGNAAIALVAGLALVSIVLIGLLGRVWAWWVAALIPVALLVGGLLHASLYVLGVLFGLLWAYVLHVRRTVLSGQSSSAGSPNG